MVPAMPRRSSPRPESDPKTPAVRSAPARPPAAERGATEATRARRPAKTRGGEPPAPEAFLQDAPTAVHWIDAEGRLLGANRAELALLGYPVEEYVGRRVREFHVDPRVAD